MNEKKSILIVDDHPLARKHLKLVLSKDFNILEAVDSKECKEILNKNRVDLVILDLFLPDVNEFELLEFIKSVYTTTPVVMVTSSDRVQPAVQALRIGASDYILKSEISTSPERILVSIQHHLLVQDLKKTNQALLEERKSIHAQFLIPKGTIYEQIYEKALKVVNAGLSLMILGETGMGKDILSKYIHQNLFPEKPFIPIDCGAICHSISEAELFGYESGAFTDAKQTKQGKIELADKGLLFLDELGNMSMDIQAKFLRVIEEKTVFRLGASKSISVAFNVISATNKDLKTAIKKGEFREDLYYRLNQFEITLPPIREYPNALEQWIDHFVCIYSQKYGVNCSLPDDLMTYWMDYSWPGNLRELKSEVQRTIFRYSIGEDLRPIVSFPQLVSEEKYPVNLKEAEKQIFIDRLTAALEKTQYNVSKASKLLGIPRTTLISRMDRYDISLQTLIKSSG